MIMTVLLGLTYAYWTVSKVQSGVNTIDSDCLHIEFTEANDIELLNTIPILDKEGLELEPYTFTIQNTCDTYANYQINLETFDVAAGQTRMHDDYIKANLQKGTGKKFSDILKTDYEVTPTITGATNAYKLATGTLKKGNVHTYNLRVWMDEHVTMDDVDSMNSFFNGKISVTLTAAIDPFSESGTLQYVGYNYSQKLWGYKNNITEVEFQNKMEPIVDAIESWDVSATNDGSVMAYMINQGTAASPEYKIYIQGNNGVRSNPNSSYLFSSFKNLKEIKGLEYFDTSTSNNMDKMFGWCDHLEELNLTSFDTSNVTSMSGMFYSSSNNVLKKLNLTSFDTSNVTNMAEMFFGNVILEELDVSNFDTSNVTNMTGMFYMCKKLQELNINNFDTSKVTNTRQIFSWCESLTMIDVSNFNTSNVTNMGDMFYCCKKIISLDVSNFDTSNVTNMYNMFAHCSALTHLNLDNFDTSNVTDMAEMFYCCEKIISLDLSNFDTSNVTNIYDMFADCPLLTNINLDNWNTSKVTNMGRLFLDCSTLEELHITHFDTSNVINMSSMFNGCLKLEELDVSNFDTSNVTDMSNMFKDAGRTTPNFILDISNFDTSNVKNMNLMFANHSNLILTLGNKFNTLNVTNMGGLFYHNESLTVNNIDVINTINVDEVK